MGISFVIFYTALVLGLCALVVLAAQKMALAFYALHLRAHEAVKQKQAERAKLVGWQESFEQKLATERANLQETIRALEEKVKNRSVDLEKALAAVHAMKAQLHAKDMEIAELKSKIKGKSKKVKNA